MSPYKILVIVVGVVVIAFIYWFFLNKSKVKKVLLVSGAIDIKVDGGYSPEVIQIPLNKTTTLNFTRTDPTPCLEEVMLSDFNVKKTLPLNQKVTMEITPTKTGEFTYTCGMGMYKGKIIVA